MWLDYEIYFYENQTNNVEIVLFDFDPETGQSLILDSNSDSNENHFKLSDLQTLAEENPIQVDFSEFEHIHVFMMARKIDRSKRDFKFGFKFRYEENLGMPIASRIILSIFLTIVGIALFIVSLYGLHINHIITLPECGPLLS